MENSFSSLMPNGEPFSVTVGYKLPHLFQIKWEAEPVNAVPAATRNTYYVCPVCGKRWGAIFYKPEGYWQPEEFIDYKMRRCIEHGNGHLLNNLSSINASAARRLPREVILYELYLWKDST